jgi:hypothetical protein
MKQLFAFTLIALLLLAIGTSAANAQTPTPSRTPSPTLSNQQRIEIATIAPPRAGDDPFNPQGPLPFQIPRFPTFFVASPSPVPLLPTNTPIPATVTPSPTFTPSPTVPGAPTQTPTATGTSQIDIDTVATMAKQIADLQGTLSFQSTNEIVIGSTPITMVEVAEQLGGAVGAPWSFVREFQEGFSGLGLVSTVITFIVVNIFFGVFIRMVTIALPILISLVRIILQVINVVLNAINIIWPF